MSSAAQTSARPSSSSLAFPSHGSPGGTSCPCWVRHRVVGIDPPGQGDSDRPLDGYDTQTVAERVHALVAHLGIKRYGLAAHDVGAWVAFLYALMLRLIAPVRGEGMHSGPLLRVSSTTPPTFGRTGQRTGLRGV
ncbi:alpha/beta fold hydrolase [Neorhizobium lilium]|uniref:alpha/beta fold hydrolase n=1 Tax=Neorhizobium lilium TaxID=2503024 RepID=UPI001FE0C885|nr:alpha/beta fold hydrolase [Neorhizobium lilium]